MVSVVYIEEAVREHPRVKRICSRLSHARIIPAYGLGGDKNFYFSHMLNCIYDCRYCFLQGMFRSAH